MATGFARGFTQTFGQGVQAGQQQQRLEEQREARRALNNYRRTQTRLQARQLAEQVKSRRQQAQLAERELEQGAEQHEDLMEFREESQDLQRTLNPVITLSERQARRAGDPELAGQQLPFGEYRTMVGQQTQLQMSNSNNQMMEILRGLQAQGLQNELATRDEVNTLTTSTQAAPSIREMPLQGGPSTMQKIGQALGLHPQIGTASSMLGLNLSSGGGDAKKANSQVIQGYLAKQGAVAQQWRQASSQARQHLFQTEGMGRMTELARAFQEVERAPLPSDLKERYKRQINVISTRFNPQGVTVEDWMQQPSEE